MAAMRQRERRPRETGRGGAAGAGKGKQRGPLGEQVRISSAADLKEVLHNQVEDLQTLLGSAFGHVGVGRDDGAEKGEYSPIFYDASQWVVLDWDTKWLSKTPDVPGSKDWDAVSLVYSVPGVRVQDCKRRAIGIATSV